MCSRIRELGLALSLAVVATIATLRSSSDIVEASVFRVVGAKGHAAAELRQRQGGGAELVMFDENGAPRMIVGLDQTAEGGAPCSTFLRFMSERGDSLLSVQASSSEVLPPWVTLTLGPNDGARMAMSCELGTHTDTLAMRLFDRTGRESAKFSAHENGGASGLVVRSFPDSGDLSSNRVHQVSMVAQPTASFAGGSAVRIGSGEGACIKMTAGSSARIDVAGERGESWEIERQ